MNLERNRQWLNLKHGTAWPIRRTGIFPATPADIGVQCMVGGLDRDYAQYSALCLFRAKSASTFTIQWSSRSNSIKTLLVTFGHCHQPVATSHGGSSVAGRRNCWKMLDNLQGSGILFPVNWIIPWKELQWLNEKHGCGLLMKRTGETPISVQHGTAAIVENTLEMDCALLSGNCGVVTWSAPPLAYQCETGSNCTEQKTESCTCGTSTHKRATTWGENSAKSKQNHFLDEDSWKKTFSLDDRNDFPWHGDDDQVEWSLRGEHWCNSPRRNGMQSKGKMMILLVSVGWVKV